MSPLPPVIFLDAVGTLLHPEPPAPAVYLSVAQRHGSRLDLAGIATAFRAAFRRQEEQDFAASLRTDEDREMARWRAIVAETLPDVDDAEACFQELYAHFALPAAWRCQAGTASLLAALTDRSCTLGLASNFDARLTGLVQGLPELAAMSHVVVSSLIGWRKPAPEFFAVLCRTVSLPAEQILFVGDDPVNDYHGARTAGMPVLLLDPHGKADVPDAVRIRTLGEILQRYPASGAC